MKRTLFRAGLVILVLIAVGTAVALAMSSRLVKKGVEYGSEQATGLEAQVGGVDLGLLSGRLGVNGLDLANPEGFDGDFLRLANLTVQVSLPSLREPVVEVPELTLDGLEIHLLQRVKQSNYRPVLDGLKRSGGKQDKKEAKTFVIRRLVIRDVSATVEVTLPGGKTVQGKVEIPEIVLENVGSQSHGVPVTEVSRRILAAVLETVARRGGSLPGGLGGDLLAGLRSASLRDLGSKTVGDVTGMDAGSLPEKAKETLESGVKKLLKP